MSTVSSLITRKPLLPVVTLTKNDDTTYTYNPFTSTFDFYVTRLQVSPPYSNTSGKFVMKLTSSDASNANANTLISNVDEGNEVTIWIGKDDSSKTKIFTGVIETWEINENNKNFMNLTISGPDFGSNILKNRIVLGKWNQRLDANGDPDVTDTTTTVQQIIIDMLSNDTYYPDQNNVVTVADQGVTVSSANIKGEDLALKSFTADYEFVGDKLTALDELSGTIHWVDPDKVFFMDYAESLSSTSSGILLTDDNTDATAIAWLPTTNIGLIAPGATYKRTLENHKKRIYGMGGVNISLDQSETTDASSTTLETNNYAMKFVPDFSQLAKIVLYISRIGTPISDFQMELREDFNGLPTGKVLRAVTKPKSFLDADTDVHRTPFEMNEELIIGQTYWIVVRKNGTSSSNTFRWHHDNVDNSTPKSAYSPTDGNPTPDWAATATPNRFDYAFETWKGDNIFGIYNFDPISATSKMLREDVIRKDDITDDQVMSILLTTETDTLFKRKEVFTAQVYAPDTLLTAGQRVRIRKQSDGYTFDAEFTLGSVEYVFEADNSPTGAFYYFIEAVRFTEIT